MQSQKYLLTGSLQKMCESLIETNETNIYIYAC